MIEHRLYNEDCIDTMKRMPDNYIDLTVTSPPYEDLRTYDGFADFEFTKIAPELYRVTKEGGVVVWVVGDKVRNGSESGESFRQALYFKDCGFNLFDTMIYEKNIKPIGSLQSYWQAFEFMFVLSKGKPKTTNLIRDHKVKYPERGGRHSTERTREGTLKDVIVHKSDQYAKRGNVWRYVGGRGHSTKDYYAFGHPAIFPEALAKDHIITWSNEGDIVYDPFMGSGTTAKMAMQANRKWIGSEIHPEYCEIIKQRIMQQTIPVGLHD